MFGTDFQNVLRPWVLGERLGVVLFRFNAIRPDQEFELYREEMLERSLPWGLSALGRFLGDLSQNQPVPLTKDLEFLPSLVKYGVPSKLACYLVRKGIRRDIATRIAELHVEKRSRNDDPSLDTWETMSTYAENAVSSLTDDDISVLNLEPVEIESLMAMKRRLARRRIDTQRNLVQEDS